MAKAKDYIDIMPFSESGLIDQLEFDGFDDADATYAVSQVKADWKEQAVLKGKDYLDVMSFSRSGLIDQLKFDGFSNDEATHAVDEIGL